MYLFVMRYDGELTGDSNTVIPFKDRNEAWDYLVRSVKEDNITFNSPDNSGHERVAYYELVGHNLCAQLKTYYKNMLDKVDTIDYCVVELPEMNI